MGWFIVFLHASNFIVNFTDTKCTVIIDLFGVTLVSLQLAKSSSGEIELPVGALPDLKVLLADLGMASEPRPQVHCNDPQVVKQGV